MPTTLRAVALAFAICLFPQVAAPLLGASEAATVSSGLTGKVIVGYQGWFGCPGDYDGNKSWVHWFKGNIPDAAHLRVDLLPDVSEYPKDALCQTGLTRADGKPIELFSSHNPGVIDLHFRWMAQYGIDGAALERFIGGIATAPGLRRLDHLLELERAAAEKSGRTFFVTYDVSGGDPKSVIADVLRDWRHLVVDLGVTSSPNYLRDHGRVVIELWGFGVKGRPGDAADVLSLINELKAGGDGLQPAFVIGGVAPEWRTLTGSARTEPEWAATYRAFDVISPWSTGRFTSSADAVHFLDALAAPDVEETKRLGIGYMPVIFPGFSWSNMTRLDAGRASPLNDIPRRCGDFYWTQIHTLLGIHPTALYAAMFDEVDEGTALFKLTTRPDALPVGVDMVALDQDGCKLTDDWYLKITGKAQHFLSSGKASPRSLPLSPVK